MTHTSVPQGPGGPARTIRSVCVFCGSMPGASPVYGEAIEAFGTELARRGLRLVYGGGRVGLMGRLADAVLRGGGEVLGVIPAGLLEREIGHGGVTELRVVTTMHERKAVMFEQSDAFVVFPGGYGTLDETFEITTWKQLGLHAKPIVLVNVARAFDPLVALLDRLLADGFIRPAHRDLVHVVTDVPSAFAYLDAYRAAPVAPLTWADPDGAPA
ncbi:MAG TPA: TIGR00730 family Rossman fold protein [Thermodesulfobacteriota bacterium]|nr:TIGR00730 family Rossman fold protein [Thermodesulfobacteriota bacterium]